MQDVSHNNVMFVVVPWQPKPQSHNSIPDGHACYPASNDMNLPCLCHGTLHVPFELSLISAHMRGRGTISVPALLGWGISTDSSHPIEFNRCRCCRCGCDGLCGWWALQRSSAWTISCTVRYLMTLVAFIRLLAAMHLTLQTTTITVTDAITELPGLLRVLWIPLLTLWPQLGEYRCHLQILFLL